MKQITYRVEKIEEAARALEEAPTLPARYKSHEETLHQLKPQIREMHFAKHYEPRQIAGILKQNGIKITIKEVKELLELSNINPATKAAQKTTPKRGVKAR